MWWCVYGRAAAGSRIPEGSTPVHAAGYGCTVRLLRRLVEFGGDVRLHDVNGLMVRHWAARQLNVARRSKNLTYLLYAQNRALTSVGRPPIDIHVAASSALPSSAQQRPSRSSSTYVILASYDGKYLFWRVSRTNFSERRFLVRPKTFRADVCFAVVFFLFFSRRVISELRRPIGAKFCTMLGAAFNFIIPVQNYGGAAPKNF